MDATLASTALLTARSATLRTARPYLAFAPAEIRSGTHASLHVLVLAHRLAQTHAAQVL